MAEKNILAYFGYEGEKMLGSDRFGFVYLIKIYLKNKPLEIEVLKRFSREEEKLIKRLCDLLDSRN